MAFKKVEKFNRLIDFDKEKQVIGFPVRVREGSTKYGEAEFLEIQLQKSDEIVSVALGASLQGFEWGSWVGVLVKIVYEGEEKSKNHKGKSFKKYGVYVDEDVTIFDDMKKDGD